MGDSSDLGDPVDVVASAADRRRRPPRWAMWAALVLVFAGGGGLLLARHGATRSNFRHLQAVWASASSLDQGRFAVTGRLRQDATPTDTATVDRALVLVQQQEAAALSGLLGRVSVNWSRDGAMKSLATAEREAIHAEVADLDQPSPFSQWGARTQQALDRLQQLLSDGQHRFTIRAPAPLPPASYPAAEPTLTRLGQLLDVALPARMLIMTAGNSQTVDTPSPVRILNLHTGANDDVATAISNVLARELTTFVTGPPDSGGFIAVQTIDDTNYAVSQSLTGSPRPLSAGDLLPAARPNAVWIYQTGDAPQVVEVDASGHRVAGPFPAPRFDATRGPAGLAVPAGLIIAGDAASGTPSPEPTGVWLWNPGHGTTLMPLETGCAYPLATHGSLLAWLRCVPNDPTQTSLHITDTTTGTTRDIPSQPTAVPYLGTGTGAAFSPDGTHLAYVSIGTGFAGWALSVLDLNTDVTTLVGQPAIEDPNSEWPYAAAITWPDSHDVLYSTGAGHAGRDETQPPFATYQLGQHTGTDIRYRPNPASLLALLLP